LYASIILAAGLSKRFPGNKLLYEWWGKPVIYHTVKNVLDSRVDIIVVVTGYMNREISNVLRQLDDRVVIVYNERYVEGMSSSVKTGVEKLLEEGLKIKALFITPGDCAWIPSIVYDLMMMYFDEYNPLILIASHHGRAGHPVLFHSVLVDELLKVNEETMGLKSIISRYKYYVRYYEVFHPGVILDLDDYSDLNRVKYTVMK